MNWKPTAYQVAEYIFVSSLIFILSEMIYRALIIIKEVFYYKKHYPTKHRYSSIIKYGFKFNAQSQTSLFLLSIFYAYMLSATRFNDILSMFDGKLVTFGLVYIVCRWLKFNQSNVDTAEWIRSGSGLDYATGMASNYFHGYLNLQLPEKGDDIKGIRQRIADYEDSNHVEFAIKRLFILIPDSLHCKPKIESRILEKAKPLEVVQKDRAGVRRPFRNDVYRFTEEIHGKLFYISVEYATPLLSFWEAMNFKITATSEMKEMKREILLQFYKSVKKFTTECPDTKKECEVVYYNDNLDQRDETDVGYVLKYHIEKMFATNKS